MAPRAKMSAQTAAVLRAFAAQPSRWRHGYDLGDETGLKSGSLYPILVRLADRKLLEACWADEQPAGRPKRHLYRLTDAGVAAASAELATQPEASRSTARGHVRRLAGESS
jgi:PadR family transcriptional regulator PadR